mmetsp:Transcript_16054/g.34787  ORF Transcript_16054/g.34787 Transcript_16054/m.34787 type:complete len:131 (-) Transcript_16054:379-771(-)
MYQQNPAFANPAYVAQLQQQQQQQQGRQQNFQQHHHQNLQQQQNFQNLRDAQRSPVQGGYAQGNFGGSVFGMGQAQRQGIWVLSVLPRWCGLAVKGGSFGFIRLGSRCMQLSGAGFNFLRILRILGFCTI